MLHLKQRFSFSHLPFKSISLTLILLLLIPLSDRFNLIDFVVVIVTVFFFLCYYFLFILFCYKSLPSFSSSTPCFCSWLCNYLYLTLLWVFIKRQFSHFVWIFFTFRWKIQFFLISFFSSYCNFFIAFVLVFVVTVVLNNLMMLKVKLFEN